MRPSRTLLAALAVAVAATGCKPENKAGPVGTHLATPVELALLGSSANVLLVSNANFQLTYDGGSLESIDLTRVDETKRLNVIDDVVMSSLPLPSFSGPIAFTSDRKTVLLPNRFSQGSADSLPDHVFFADVSDPSSITLEDTVHAGPDPIPGAVTVGQDPYGIAAYSLPPVGPGRPVRDRAVVANQTDGTVSLLDLTPGTYCADNEPAPCLDDAVPPPFASEPVFADVGTASNLAFDGPGVAPQLTITQHWSATFVEEATSPCGTPTDGSPEGEWRIEGSVSGVQQHHACTGLVYITPDGVTFLIRRPTDSSGNPVGGPPSSGDRFDWDVTYGDLVPDSPVPLDQSFVASNGAVISGRGVGSALYDPFRNRLYFTGRLNDFVYVLDADTLHLLGVFAVSTNVGGRDTRGLALAPDGSKLYVIDRSPESMLIVDPDTLPVGAPQQIVNDAVVDSVPVGAAPSELAVTPDGTTALVTDNLDDTVDVIDLVSRVRRDLVKVGHGPYGIVLSPDGLRAYVACYLASSVDVIDLDPSSPTYATVLTTIGNSDYVPEF